MNTLNHILIIISGCSFILYGILLLSSKKMKDDFIRFNLESFINFIGVIEIAGGIGMLLGLKYPLLLTISSFGLSLLMALGIFTRIRVDDTFKETLQAIIFLIINLYILYFSI